MITASAKLAKGEPANSYPTASARKQRKCKICPTKFIPDRPMQVVCGLGCARELAERKRIKVEQDRAKAERRLIRARKERLKTRYDYIHEAQNAFNRYVRLRDQLAGHACISSGKPLDWSGNNVDAGHYRARGSAPHLRFNEDNCHAQSKQENRYASGNVVAYRINLIARIGLARVEALECDNGSARWTIDELKQITQKYREKYIGLKKAVC